ncbi:hypothetical protein B0H14DRAFT_3163788 [Mycena olivaceomarginata]|nr:hypothetical protein B0H14DRAFT_3163788 [Mycena olivaceomarginata]
MGHRFGFAMLVAVHGGVYPDPSNKSSHRAEWLAQYWIDHWWYGNPCTLGTHHETMLECSRSCTAISETPVFGLIGPQILKEETRPRNAFPQYRYDVTEFLTDHGGVKKAILRTLRAILRTIRGYDIAKRNEMEFSPSWIHETEGKYGKYYIYSATHLQSHEWCPKAKPLSERIPATFLDGVLPAHGGRESPPTKNADIEGREEYGPTTRQELSTTRRNGCKKGTSHNDAPNPNPTTRRANSARPATDAERDAAAGRTARAGSPKPRNDDHQYLDARPRAQGDVHGDAISMSGGWPGKRRATRRREGDEQREDEKGGAAERGDGGENVLGRDVLRARGDDDKEAAEKEPHKGRVGNDANTYLNRKSLSGSRVACAVVKNCRWLEVF